MQNIKDNARSFDHPTRKVKLYEDIEFSGEMGMSNKRKNVRELELQTEEQKKKKKREARPREREAGPRESQARLLAPSAKTRLQKALAVNKKQYDLLQTAIAHAQDPKYMCSSSRTRCSPRPLNAQGKQKSPKLRWRQCWKRGGWVHRSSLTRRS